MKKALSPGEARSLLAILSKRFADHPARHKGISWSEVEDRLQGQPGKLWSLAQMEATGGEPDVVGLEEATGAFLFFDCAPESPKGRRSLCYDPEALRTRKEHKPAHSALGLAADMGIDVLDEAQYRQLQQSGPVDTKTSSWLLTPEPVRQLGGAIFGDQRYGQVFVYHNGAESYYAARGFRGVLRV